MSTASERVCGEIGHPMAIMVDNSGEFISRDLGLRAFANNVGMAFSRSCCPAAVCLQTARGGKQMDKSLIEAFSSKFRTESLNAHWFMTLACTREKLEAWRKVHNEARLHSAMGHNVPNKVHNPAGAASPSS